MDYRNIEDLPKNLKAEILKHLIDKNYIHVKMKFHPTFKKEGVLAFEIIKDKDAPSIVEVPLILEGKETIFRINLDNLIE